MERKGYGSIPTALYHWITFLAGALPVRSMPVFIELLVGVMLSGSGFVTEALQAIEVQRHWTSYYHWLRCGRWSWKRLGQVLGILLRSVIRRRVYYLVIDDTLGIRVSKNAPGSGQYYEHSRKPNRPRYVQGQCFVNLSAVFSRGRRVCSALPLLWRLQRCGGQGTKLRSAQVLIRTVGQVFQDLRVRVLLDSWYMRRSLIEYIGQWGFEVIGQVRIDTALYTIPPPPEPGKRGRRRIYGDKCTGEWVEHLPEQRRRMWVYGRRQWVRYRSAAVKARFLKGRLVRAVWVQFEHEDGTLGRRRLLLATEASLRAEVVILAYARRWPVEPMFNQFRHHWGAVACWQQSRQTLARWLQILSCGYTLMQMLALKGGTQLAGFAELTPWRREQPLTAGRIRWGLRRILGHIDLRAWWDPKSRKFHPPDRSSTAPSVDTLSNAA
jgi:hypothetical protein